MCWTTRCIRAAYSERLSSAEAKESVRQLIDELHRCPARQGNPVGRRAAQVPASYGGADLAPSCSWSWDVLVAWRSLVPFPRCRRGNFQAPPRALANIGHSLYRNVERLGIPFDPQRRWAGHVAEQGG